MQDMLLNAKIALNVLGLRQKKIFAIGFNKSATSSLHALFHEIGRPSYHGVDWQHLENHGVLKKYDCFSDGTPTDIAKLDGMFPNSKYIMQVRDLRTWIISRLEHIARYKDDPGYQTKEDWDVTEAAIENWILRRQEHHKTVMHYFADRPDDLVVVNFIKDPDAATKVANFLGYPGERARPKENVNPKKDINPEFVTMLENCCNKLGVDIEDLENDLLCPSLEKTPLSLPVDTRFL